MRIQIWASCWQKHGLHALGLQDRLERRTKLAVPIHEHVPLAEEKTIFDIGQVLGDLLHPGFISFGTQPLARMYFATVSRSSPSYGTELKFVLIFALKAT